MFCDKCEALGETCCSASKARRETNNRLANLVDRMSAALTKARIERDAARTLLDELMALHAVKP